MIELHAQYISEPQLLAVFSYSCLNIYNSPYANVCFLPVTTTYSIDDNYDWVIMSGNRWNPKYVLYLTDGPPESATIPAV